MVGGGEGQQGCGGGEDKRLSSRSPHTTKQDPSSIIMPSTSHHHGYLGIHPTDKECTQASWVSLPPHISSQLTLPSPPLIITLPPT